MAVLQPGASLQGGKFVVVSQLGRGGFGAVYLARQTHLERNVAIKVLHPEHAAQRDTIARFRREALAAASLSHPHVLPVFDFDYDAEAGLWFLVMQYVAGARTLDDVALPLHPTETARIIAGVASALDAAHARGIVHRDVKPANVLLDGNHPLLTDFGIAYLGGATVITGAGLAIGTPAYMSPEQALGREVEPASDQYSLGVMAYHLLAGRAPYTGDVPSLLYQHVHEPTPSPITLNPALPPSVGAVVLRALHKSPEARYPSCGAFASELVVAAAAQPEDSGPTQLTPTWVLEPGMATGGEGVELRRTRGGEKNGETAATVAPGRIAATRWARAVPLSGVPRQLAGAVIIVILAVVLSAGAVIRAGVRPGTASPPELAGLSPAAGSGGPTRSATVLRDDFEDPGAGFLPAASPDGAAFRIGYVAGEYEIAGPRGGFVAIPGIFRDSTLTLDARLVGDATGRSIGLTCRASEEGWYQLNITPDTRSFSIARFTLTGAAVPLIAEQVGPAIQRGTASNHLSFRCTGSMIVASANGVELASVQDDALHEGWYQVSAHAVPGPSPTDEVVLRLDNLVITQP